MKYFIFIVLVSLFSYGKPAKLPSNFKICKRSDPDLNGCFKDAVQVALPLLKDGVPELGIAQAEPLEVDSMTIDGGSGSVNVKQNYKNLKIHGITESIVNDAKFSIVENKEFKGVFTITIPKCHVEADYDFDGQVMMLPITGKGKMDVKFDNLKAVLTMSGEAFQKKGKTYVKMSDLTVALTPDTASFHFDNLFNGDKALGDQMNNMINESWKDLFGDVSKGYEDMLAGVIKNVANSVFTKVPYDELLPV